MTKVIRSMYSDRGGLVVRMETKSLNTWIARIEDKRKKINNLRPYFTSVGAYVLSEINTNFSAEGRPAWRPLAQFTREDRARRGYPAARPILFRSGKFRSSFGYTATDRGLLVKNPMKTKSGYTLYDLHQEGRGNNPVRKTYILGVQDRKAFSDLFRRFFDE